MSTALGTQKDLSKNISHMFLSVSFFGFGHCVNTWFEIKLMAVQNDITGSVFVRFYEKKTFTLLGNILHCKSINMHFVDSILLLELPRKRVTE